MSKKRNTSLVAFQCPHQLLTEIDELAYVNMMDRTEFLVAAVAKFVEYVERREESTCGQLLEEASLLYMIDHIELGE